MVAQVRHCARAVESPPPVDIFCYYHCYNFPVMTVKHLLLTESCLLKQFYNRWKYGVFGDGWLFFFFFFFVQPRGWGYSSCSHIFQLRKHLHISGFSYSESLLTWVTLCVLLYPWLYVMKIQLGRGDQGAKR